MYIVGASTLGEIACSVIKRGAERLDGFFDDYYSDNVEFCGAPVIGKLDKIFKMDAVKQAGVFVAIGDNLNRRLISERLTAAGIPLVNIIDPTAVLEEDVILGAGNMIMSHVYIGVKTIMGNGNIVFPGVSITHHNKIGCYNFFSPNTSIGGYTEIANECKVGMNCCVLPYNKIASHAHSLPCTVLGEINE
ncbi:PglD-related sugar-binding protein [Aeromonas lacus]